MSSLSGSNEEFVEGKRILNKRFGNCVQCPFGVDSPIIVVYRTKINNHNNTNGGFSDILQVFPGSMFRAPTGFPVCLKRHWGSWRWVVHTQSSVAEPQCEQTFTESREFAAPTPDIRGSRLYSVTFPSLAWPSSRGRRDYRGGPVHESPDHRAFSYTCALSGLAMVAGFAEEPSPADEVRVS